MIEIPCKCGHVGKWHLKNSTLMIGTHWCEKCSTKDTWGSSVMFHNYGPDNLKYIEDLAKERNLI